MPHVIVTTYRQVLHSLSSTGGFPYDQVVEAFERLHLSLALTAGAIRLANQTPGTSLREATTCMLLAIQHQASGAPGLPEGAQLFAPEELAELKTTLHPTKATRPRFTWPGFGRGGRRRN
jgi:hypothetical protein